MEAILHAGGMDAEFVTITSTLVNKEKSKTEDGRVLEAVDMSFRMNVYRNESDSVVSRINEANLTELEERIEVAMTRKSLDATLSLSRLDAQVVPDYMQNPADIRGNVTNLAKDEKSFRSNRSANATVQALPPPPAPPPLAPEYEPEEFFKG
jgi:hypothetical protein